MLKYRFNVFTSHYVTINSEKPFGKLAQPMIFTSHYVTINSDILLFLVLCLNYLHPTM